MSKSATGVSALLEWSPQGVRVWTQGQSSVIEAGSIAEAASHLRGQSVGVAVARRHAFLKQLRLPNTSKEDASQILRLQLDQLFPVSSSELAVDFAFVGDAGPEGRPAVVAAMKADLLRQLHGEMKSAGLKPAWVIPAAFGAQALAQQMAWHDGMVLEATQEGLAIDVIQGGCLAGSRMAGSRSSSIDVSAEAARTEAAYRLSNPQILLAGGLDAGLAGTRSKNSSLSALAGAPPDLNLVLPEVSAQRAAKVVNGRRTLAVLLGLAVLSLGMLIWDERDTKSAELTKLAKDHAKRKKNLTESKGRFTSRLATMDSGTQVLANAFTPAQTATDAITVATNLLPEKTWLTGISFERGRRMTLRGTALTGDAVSDFVDALAAQNRFRDVELAFANNTKLEETPVVQFSVSLHVIGNLPLIDKSKQRRGR
jgi:Tfp pilus assembly protein PilN